jgi:hypothetical protein
MSSKRSGPSPHDPREKPSPEHMAHVIRFNLNWQWTAVNLQHERLVGNVFSRDDLVEVSMRKHLTGMVDMDFLVISVYRLFLVANQAKGSGCDVNGILKDVIKDFESRWSHITGARNALQHIDDRYPKTLLLPMSSSNGDWQFAMPGNSIDMHELFKDAKTLAQAVAKVIKPYEPQQG